MRTDGHGTWREASVAPRRRTTLSDAVDAKNQASTRADAAPSGFFSISGFTENMMQQASIVSLTPAGGFPMVRTCVDTVTKLPRLAHTTRRRSDSLVDGVTVA